MNLYLVKCRGMHSSATEAAHGVAYVVAEDPSKAYSKLREYLCSKEIGFARERELQSVELLADSSEYPDCGNRLYL